MAYKIELPMHPKKNRESLNYYDQILNTLYIISYRIKKGKIKQISSDKLESSFILSLDIKSLYIYSKFLLDYTIKYISETYFSNIKNHEGKGLKSRSYDSHMRYLKNSNFSNFNSVFNQYRRYIVNYDGKFYFKIINIRDKLITHTKLMSHESWTYNESENKFCIILSKTEPFLPISRELRNQIYDLSFKFSIQHRHIIGNYNFFFFDKLLDKIERLDREFTSDERDIISKCRIKLGISLNEDGIINLLLNFLQGLCSIVSFKDHLYIPHYLEDIVKY